MTETTHAFGTQCECGIDEEERCGECGGCDCPDNPGVCDGPGCIGAADLEQMRDERGEWG